MTVADEAATRVIADAARGLVRCVRPFLLRIREPHGRSRTDRFVTLRTAIGSASGNGVVLDDDAVSRLHAEIVGDDVGYRLRDLESRNGTFVDDRRVRDVYLGTHARVRVGLTELEFEVLAEQDETPLGTRDRLGELVGSSAAMRELYVGVERAARTSATVLVDGETGTGKELVARALHEMSPRAAGPFVVLDCAATPGDLFESVLFGHERGAFTGAISARSGLAEDAHGGTLFLDEVGELPLPQQAKLLRFLETREVRRVGGSKTRSVDVRFIAATHRDLVFETARGAFREDLWFRVAVLRVHVPALREHIEDLPVLVRELVLRGVGGDGARAERLLLGLTEATWSRLRAHRWPGNVRELRNVVERSLALGEAPLAGTSAGTRSGADTAIEPLAFALRLDAPLLEQKRAAVDALERVYLTKLLERHGGRIGKAAEAAGIDRVYYRRLLDKLGR